MVKRQTVWLSTMMVLSLMLIGYYTINSGGSNPSPTDNSVATASTSPPASATGNATTGAQNTPSGSSNATDTSSSANTSGTASGNAVSASDWFVQSRTQVEQNMTKSTDMYEQIMANQSSTNAEVAQAQQDLEQVQSIQGGMQNARDAILGDGYQDVVIFPNIDPKSGDLTSVSVYVKTNQLSTNQAVQIMNIVSQHMSTPLDNITVHKHA